MIVSEYVDRRGRGAFSDAEISGRNRRALNAEMDRLSQLDLEMAIGSILHRGGAPNIRKMKVKGDVQLRPRFCVGPGDNQATYLVGVEKKGTQRTPRNPGDIAVERRDELMRGVAMAKQLREHKEPS